MKKILLLILIANSVLSCKKEDPQPDSISTNTNNNTNTQTNTPIEASQVYIYSVTASPTASESITIKNNSGTTQNISGWTLGDSNNPTAYSIPSNTILSQGELKTFSHTTLGFQINDSGEHIYLKNSSSITVDTWSN